MALAIVNRMPMNYEINGQGEPLLFLHGLGSSTADWQIQVDYFQDSYQCITFDTRGHGRTAKPPGPYSIKGFAADTAGLLDSLEIPAAHFVGLSLGGFITFQMAVDYPDRVKSMVVINSAPAVVPGSFRDRLKIWQRKYMFQILSMERIGKTIGARLFPDPEHEEILAEFVARWAKNDKKAYMAATNAMVGWSVQDQIGAIETPTLVIAADQDYTPVEHKEAYVSLMPDAELLVIPNARHAVNVTHPETVNEAIAAFLDRVIAAADKNT